MRPETLSGEPAASSDAAPMPGFGGASPMPGFSHQALFYSDTDEFLAAAVPFVEGALEREEAVMVAVTRPKTHALRSELGVGAQRVRFADMEQLGRNPARIIPAWRRFVDDHASPGHSVRGIGEPIWRGRGTDELAECRRHEALLNLAFANAPAWELMCPYDTSALDDDTLAAACHSHPYLSECGALCESDAYLPPELAPHPFGGELAEPDGQLFEIHFDLERLAIVRRLIVAHASAAGLTPTRTSDLVLAVNELASNSVSHGGGHGSLRIWRRGRSLICEVRDRGRIEDPLAGRREPGPEQPRGRGLWIANQICDLVQIRCGEGWGTAVRVHMQLP
jgi:anti-sigma regulatory factor (Ser/Thr protein kinase)